MSNKNNNNLPLTHANGQINGDNPFVCAVMIDGLGTLLCAVFSDLKARPDILELMNDATKKDLETILSTMKMLRDAIGVDQDWHGDNLAYKVADIYAEADQKRKTFSANLVKAMLDAGLPLDMIPPEYRPKPSVADAADAMLAMLRDDGVIG
jgi:hypothetical protein